MIGYNVNEWVERVVTYARIQANSTRGSHQMWTLGGDFAYQAASRWFANIDKLIHYVNLDGRVRLLYSTPSLYLKSKRDVKGDWELRTDDLFPLADGPHEYWTGYFTSRPALKTQYRASAALLQAARQIETLAMWMGVERPAVSAEQVRPTPRVGTGFTDDLEGALAVASHHDGITGTARQSVTNDYQWRLSLGAKRARAGMSAVLARFAGLQGEGHSCAACDSPRDCLNISACAFSAEREAFSVVVWNPLARNRTVLFAVPVGGANALVIDGAGAIVESQMLALDDATRKLATLHVNAFGLSREQLAQAKRGVANAASHEVYFAARLPPLGYDAFRVLRVNPTAPPVSEGVHGSDNNAAGSNSADGAAAEAAGEVEWVHGGGRYKIGLHRRTRQVTALANVRSGVSTSLSVDWGFYESSPGGCSGWERGDVACTRQASGAYIFRPTTLDFKTTWRRPVTTSVETGPLFTVIRQTFSPSASHAIYLARDADAVRVEWTAGPMDIDDGTGKELVVRYSTGLRTGDVFETDANAREAVARERNRRGAGYPRAYESQHEPVSSNYYPVNSFIAVGDGAHEFAVVTETTQAGSSLAPGQVELMVLRRTLRDDFRGVEEPLNETMCGCGDVNAAPGSMGAHGALGDGGCVCAGLAVRGSHHLILDHKLAARATRRSLAFAVVNPAQSLFFDALPTRPRFAAVRAGALPPNVELVTLSSNYANGKLLRLAHLFAKGEHPEWSGKARVDLNALFVPRVAQGRVLRVVEVSPTANQPVESVDSRRIDWNVDAREGGGERRVPVGADGVVVLRAMEVRTFWVQWVALDDGKRDAETATW